jgi:opacity protein-like surface antigen
MKRKLAFLICLVFVLGVLSSGSTWAGKPDKDWKDWFGHFAIGYVVPEGDAADVVDSTWMLSGGATWWPGAVGLDFDLGWADFDVSNEAIQKINDAISQDPLNDGTVNDGSISTWWLTTDAIWSPENEGTVSFYIAGGIGAYYLDGQLTTTGLIYYPPSCDPWYPWWCYPGGVGTGNYVVGSQSEWEFGYNAGIGLNIELASGSQIYLEAKYHYIDTNTAVTIIPIQIGFRW